MPRFRPYKVFVLECYREAITNALSTTIYSRTSAFLLVCWLPFLSGVEYVAYNSMSFICCVDDLLIICEYCYYIVNTLLIVQMQHHKLSSNGNYSAHDSSYSLLEQDTHVMNDTCCANIAQGEARAILG
eukprot:864799-Amphidinium_carterae.1